MKRLMGKIILGSLVISGILSLISGCSSQTTSPNPASPTTPPGTSSPVRSSSPSATITISNSPSVTGTAVSPSKPAVSTDIQTAGDQIVKNILVSLDNKDYAGFSKDFSQTVKNALNQTAFNQLYDQVKTAVGDYQSVLFVSGNVQAGTYILAYVAQFSKEPAGFTVILGLQAVNGSYLVQGLNFDSPNMRGQPLDVPKVLAYADPETENILVSLNNNDYANFSKDFNAVVKNAIPESGFSALYNLQKSTVGDYQSSKEFESASTQNGIVTVRYLAKYSEEPAGVWVTIAFDGNNKVTGLFFNSPRLSAAQSK